MSCVTRHNGVRRAAPARGGGKQEVRASLVRREEDTLKKAQRMQREEGLAGPSRAAGAAAAQVALEGREALHTPGRGHQEGALRGKEGDDGEGRDNTSHFVGKGRSTRRWGIQPSRWTQQRVR
ncbi:hypothetical protein NDU88_000996 [Pleurodeles waltl]|uniref:Uncharacterized protein n=1 Tax=Pleurodeles waltl TaxID=8319 RepID=A0AAV7VYX4_PLEWA|nr:hypothetical protein NDU88_000996 [Pleurodeles waltl]